MDGEIGMSLSLNFLVQEGLQGFFVGVQEERIGTGDKFERRVGGERENQGVIETTGTLQNRTPSTDTAKNGDRKPDSGTSPATGLVMAFVTNYFLFDLIGVAEDNEIIAGLPEAENRGVGIIFDEFQEGFVTRQILRRSGICQVEILHNFG